MEDRKSGRDKQVEWVQQQVLLLKEHHVELPANAEDLKNCSQPNNVRIKGVPTQTEGSNLREYVEAPFRHILGAAEDTNIQLDCDSPRPDKAPLAEIMTCVHDFPIKEYILCKALDAHLIQFHATPVLYQDLAAITLKKWQVFCLIMDHLCQAGITYSWGHSFRIIFRHNWKLHQLRSLTDACTILGIVDSASADSYNRPRTIRKQSSQWHRVRDPRLEQTQTR
ncbi:hypothetical protein NDU88_003130 [Pleurodeles waltl]|uniref:Uncharacterized protein n=1 Tax=Pleurodeles waltl TaxID=8319 RepID=A0AAV7LR80_PLEWA|nr:hypothetical protein NDU88_003130 [Pleurodeles waltl]